MSGSVAKNEKNKELLIKYHDSKDKKYYDELFLNNVNLVRHCIVEYIYNPKLSKKGIMDEYFSVGCMGLHNAIINFDIKTVEEQCFSTFAFICIRNEIIRAINKEFKTKVEVPLNDEIEVNDDTLAIKYNQRPDHIVEEKIYNEYKTNKVMDAIGKLDDRSREIIELIYGFNDENMLSPQQISEKLGVSLLDISKILLNAREYLKKELSEFKQEYVVEKKNKSRSSKLGELYAKYGKERVDLVISGLSEKNQEMISLYYGLKDDKSITLADIAKIVGTTEATINTMMSRILNTIEKRIEKPKKGELGKLYIEYGKEKVDDIVKELDLTIQEAIKLYYGVGDNKKATIKEVANKLNCSPSSVNVQIYRAIEIIKRKIENPHKKSSKVRFKLLCKTYGKEKVESVIKSLNKESQELIQLYYGLNGESFNVSQIKKEYGYSLSGVYSRLNKIVLDIEKKLQNQIVACR